MAAAVSRRARARTCVHAFSMVYFMRVAAGDRGGSSGEMLASA